MKCSSAFALLVGLVLQLTGAGCMAQVLAHRDARYHLQAGDEITIQYRYTPEYDATVYIEPDGSISLPLVGDVQLGGLTLAQANSLVTVKASARLNKPEVTIILKDFQKPYYVVGGEVTTPGRFDIRGRVTALEAIEIAGGFKTTARSSQILLIRPVDHARAETRLINLKGVMNGKNVDEDVDLRAGDMLIVPKNKLSKVEPYIKLASPSLFFNPLSF